MRQIKVVAVLPAKNEARNIGKVIDNIKKTKTVDKIIVVNNLSTDYTEKIAILHGAEVINCRQSGVGISTRIGIKEAQKCNPDVIITLDADGQHDPIYIPLFVGYVYDGYDFVIGRRDFKYYPLIKKFGNYILTHLAGTMCPTGIKDTECGYRAMSLTAAKKIKLRANRYEICMDFIYNVWKHKLKTSQINIKSEYVSHKGTNIIDGIRNAWFILNR